MVTHQRAEDVQRRLEERLKTRDRTIATALDYGHSMLMELMYYSRLLVSPYDLDVERVRHALHWVVNAVYEVRRVVHADEDDKIIRPVVQRFLVAKLARNFGIDRRHARGRGPLSTPGNPLTRWSKSRDSLIGGDCITSKTRAIDNSTLQDYSRDAGVITRAPEKIRARNSRDC
jgi:hypothetical protein